MNNKNNIYIIDNQRSNNLIEFFLCDESLYWSCCSNEQRKDTKIIDDVKIFDLCIDNKENIHVVCVLNSGKLIYLAYDKGNWSNRVFQSFPKEANSIDQLKIISIDDIIHIFYDFKITTKLNNNYNYKSFIIHTYKHNGEWIQAYISAFHDPINPKFFVDMDSHKNIIVCYLYSDFKTSYICSLIFSKNKMRWQQAKDFQLDNPNIAIMEFLIDLNNNIHFIFYNKSCNEIYHNSTDSSFNPRNRYSLITPIKENISSLIFFQKDHRLWIMWKYKDSVIIISSNDFGETWNDFSKKVSAKLKKIKYLYSYNTSKTFKTITSFGYLNDGNAFVLGINEAKEIENNAIATKISYNEDDNKTEEDNIHVMENDVKSDISYNNNPSNSKGSIIIEESYIPKASKKDKSSIWRKITNYLTMKD